MRVAFVTDWGDKKSAFYSNKDGILKMMQVLRDRDGFETMFFRKHPDQTFIWEHDCIMAHVSPNPAKAVLEWKPDVIVFFGDFSRPIMGELENCGIPIAQLYSGGRFTHFAHVPQLIFVESKSYIEWMKTIPQIKGKVIQAFGTNTELFKPYPDQPKFFDAFFPATFASWKRHQLFTEAMGSRGLVCGWWQEHEMDIIRQAMKGNVGILHHQPAESMALLYSMARSVVVTSMDTGGSQRTVLEAMACNVPTIVMADSTMTSEYIRECQKDGFRAGMIIEPNVADIRKAVDQIIPLGPTDAREWIMKNYSEYIYADKVRDGLVELVNK